MIIDNRYYRIKSIFGYRLRALHSAVRYAKFESMQYFIDIDILRNFFIDVDINISIIDMAHRYIEHPYPGDNILKSKLVEIKLYKVGSEHF